MPKCKSCGAEIVWIEMNPTGKKMPMNTGNKPVFVFNPAENEYQEVWGREAHVCLKSEVQTYEHPESGFDENLIRRYCD